ncbi:zinc-responsive transcriptional regulator [mine drainage metagenome]|uniref:Zinc-responsive transcriptional regulator n=1 Tax=mine drainage metagenome TaxID=410659 RepID=A0A1J5PQ12_9ZZZZ
MSVPARAYLSIGEVLAKLRGDFPDVTISKIRFLESEGLVEPQRTPSGYRKFTNQDLDRLRYVLGAQRDQYLPLKVIKDHLDALDRGLQPPALPGGAPRVPRVAAVDGVMTPESFGDQSDLRLSRAELLEATGLAERQLAELESYGLISIRGNHYENDALSVGRSVAAMAAFGIESRHLRAFKSAADREVGLIEQVITPLLRQRNSEARERADEVQKELASLSVALHAALVRTGLRRMR